MNQTTKQTKKLNPVSNAVDYGFLAFASFCPYSRTDAPLLTGFSILEANMQESQKPPYDPTEIEVQSKNHNQKSIKEDARKFEQIIRETRQRLGLEVSI